MNRPPGHLKFAVLSILGAVGITPLLGGCSWSNGSTRSFLVLGFGVVNVTEPAMPEHTDGGLMVRRVEAMGLLAGPNPAVGGLLIGGTRRQEVLVPPGANVLTEAVTYADNKFWVNIRYIDPNGGSTTPPVQQDTPQDHSVVTNEDPEEEETP